MRLSRSSEVSAPQPRAHGTTCLPSSEARGRASGGSLSAIGTQSCGSGSTSLSNAGSTFVRVSCWFRNRDCVVKTFTISVIPGTLCNKENVVIVHMEASRHYRVLVRALKF